MKGEYYLGLDMGSSSVGWAVTNEKFKRPNIDQICEKDKSSKSNAGRNIL